MIARMLPCLEEDDGVRRVVQGVCGPYEPLAG